jgi:uncharacterized protein GlcG (DUF336 family)
MIQTKTIDLETANAIPDAVIAASRARNLHPMTMCILDPGGHVVAAQREDHSGILGSVSV